MNAVAVHGPAPLSLMPRTETWWWLAGSSPVSTRSVVLTGSVRTVPSTETSHDVTGMPPFALHSTEALRGESTLEATVGAAGTRDRAGVSNEVETRGRTRCRGARHGRPVGGGGGQRRDVEGQRGGGDRLRRAVHDHLVAVDRTEPDGRVGPGPALLVAGCVGAAGARSLATREVGESGAPGANESTVREPDTVTSRPST